MEARRRERLQHITIYAFAIAAAGLGVVFYSGFAVENWPILLSLSLVFLYLQTVVVRIGERSDYSMSTASIFPLIYLCGITPAMIVSALGGLADGLVYKKDWRRTMFNMAQLAISAFLGALVHQFSTARLGTGGAGPLLSMVAGCLVYIFSNISFVALVVAIWRGMSWWSQLKALWLRSCYSSLSSAFIGLIFTFFVMRYRFWGAVGFGAMLINLSEMLKVAVEVSSERARRKELEEELVVDEMTGAYNFRFLNQWLGAPSEEQVAVLFFDIDNFAVFNNTYGHAEGDKVLKLFVETINQSVRAEDKVIRYGGDEFVVLLEGMSSEGAARVAERVMANLRQVKGSWQKPITVSVGVAAKPGDTRDRHQLLLFADQAMYAAKEAGKDTIRIWSCDCATAAAAKEDPC